MYFQWSATLAVQEISQHTDDQTEIKQYLGQGEPVAFKYQPRPKRKPKENIRNKHLGFLTESHKLLTRLKRGLRRAEAGVETPEALIQHIANMDDQITAEKGALLPSAPKHSDVGLEASKWTRTLAALKKHRQVINKAVTNIRNTIQASIDYVHSLEYKDRKEAFDVWIERILDASQRYRKAHAFTRGAPKAPPPPTHIWVKEEFVGHPHEIAQIYCKEWEALWDKPNTKSIKSYGIRCTI